MIKSKRINMIVAVAVGFALIISIGLVIAGNVYNENGDMKTETEYATKIFDTDIISIEIIADEADWQEMLDNAISEQYIMADVIVNGTKFQNVGVRPKGNSSLSQVASSDSDRYSFRLQFDEYIKGQTCFGLESFVVNNMLGDNTYMKEYVSYELMQEIGVEAPYFGYADMKVNGENWGLYLAVELYNESYEARTFGITGGMMYNVKSMDMGGNNEDGNGFPQGNGNPPANGQGGNFPQGGMQPPTNRQGEQTQPSTQAEANPSAETQTEKPNGVGQMERPNSNFGGPMGGRGSNGGSLEYSTDEVSSYSAIFNNVIGKGDDGDFKRVITALKALSEGENLETYFNIDQILRYLAAHTIVVNLDSYSSSMAQNYYLYENEGMITILPWDYNLAWGGFQSESASSVINFPIDSPVSGVDMSSRPLLEKLFSNTEYLEKYHGYLQELMTSYFKDGKWEEKITQLDALISDYVKNDNTAFCTFEEYNTAVEAFKTLGNLRYQSIQGQLDGTVPSTTAEQTANPDKLISAENLSLSSLGSMMGGNHGDAGDRATNWNNPEGGERFNSNQEENMPERDLMMQAMQILQDTGGTVTEEVKLELLELGLTEEQISMISQTKNGFSQRPGSNMQNSAENNTNFTPKKGDASLPFEGQTTSGASTTESLLIYLGLFALVLLSTFFVAKKKRNY